MVEKAYRYIFLLFFVFISGGTYIYRVVLPDIPHQESNAVAALVSILCLAFFGLSYTRYFRYNNIALTIAFKYVLSTWFTCITAMNYFTSDYAYSLILILFILGLMFTNSRSFAIFYLYTFLLLFVLSFYYPSIGTNKTVFLIITFLAGMVMYFILINRDIYSKKIRTLEKDSRLILENSFGIFFFIDKNYRIITFNKSVAEYIKRINGITLREGKSVLDVFPEQNTESIKEHIERALNGEIVRNEINITYYNKLKIWLDCIFVPVYDQNYDMIGVSITGIDISEKKRSENELIRQNIFMDTLLDTINNPIFYKDKNGVFQGCNKSFETIIGLSRKEIIGKTEYEINLAELSKTYHERDIDLIQQGGSKISEARIKYADGKYRDVIFHKSTYKTNDNNVGGMVGIIVDITERKRIEKTLFLSEQRFRDMANTLPLLIYEADDKGNVTYFNKIGFQLTGYTQADYNKGISLLQMFPEEEKHRAFSNSVRTLNGEILGAHEFNLKRKDGAIVPVIINTVPIYNEGKIIGRRGVVTDISQLKSAEEKIRNSLNEKEILLSEIHHRVKNNLQVIVSMLNLQCRDIKDEQTLEIFFEAQNRIKSMSLVHENLYKAENFSSVRIKEYLNNLIDVIKTSYINSKKNIEITNEIEDLTLNIDTLIPIGLIVNELVTNAIKYAFPEKTGKIKICFKKQDNGKYKLSIIDDGIGIKDGFTLDEARTLGLRLVNMLITQLDAKIDITTNKGTRFVIIFKEYNGRE